jgi:mercuric ion binding protein
MVRIGFAVMLLAASSPAWAVERSVTLAVRNMTCATCPIAVRMAIKAVAGVREVNVDLAKRTAVVTFDDSQTTVDQLAEASRLAGFPATRKD